MRCFGFARCSAVLTAVVLFGSCVPFREPMLMQPLPPGYEYPWRAASEARTRVAASVAVARASLLFDDAFVEAGNRAARTSAPDIAAAPATSARVNLNTASATELETLPRVGPAMAAAIAAARPFRRVEDLRRVRGIGTATFEQLRELVTVDAN